MQRASETVKHYKNTNRHTVQIPEGGERKEQKEQLKKPWLKTSVGCKEKVNIYIQEVQ